MSGASGPASLTAGIPVAILAGGLGTRLRPSIGDRQKVLAEVAGRPFLAFLLDRLAMQGFRDVVLCVGHRAAEAEAALGTTQGTLRLRYSREPFPLGTAGALRHALPLLDAQAALVLNGDSFCDADLAAAWAWHSAERSQATLVLVEASDTSRYGRVEVDDSGVIDRFVEKQEARTHGWINAGIYLLARTRIASIPAGRPLSLERDVFPRWVGNGLRGWRTRARFIDIGTPESYAEALSFFASRNSGADQ